VQAQAWYFLAEQSPAALTRMRADLQVVASAVLAGCWESCDLGGRWAPGGRPPHFVLVIVQRVSSTTAVILRPAAGEPTKDLPEPSPRPDPCASGGFFARCARSE